jgi:hypothetical protein
MTAIQCAPIRFMAMAALLPISSPSASVPPRSANAGAFNEEYEACVKSRQAGSAARVRNVTYCSDLQSPAALALTVRRSKYGVR